MGIKSAPMGNKFGPFALGLCVCVCPLQGVDTISRELYENIYRTKKAIDISLFYESEIFLMGLQST